MRPLRLVVVAVVAACSDPQASTASGTVEIVESDVAPAVAGRVSRLLADDGASVRAGQTLVILSSTTLPAEIEQRMAAAEQARADLAAAIAGPRAPELQRAEAELRAATAEADRAARDAERLRGLADKGDVSRQQADLARAAAQTSAARRDAAAESLRLLRAGSRDEAIRAARARVAQAEAAVNALRATAGELVLTAPVTGVVLDHYAEVGELVPAGRAVMTIGETTRPYVMVYVNQKRLPYIHVGDAARATLDGDPDHPIAGRVAAISPRAEYTPRVALTKDERADLMFGVKVTLDDQQGRVKAGLPVSVEFPGGQAAAPVRSDNADTTVRMKTVPVRKP